MMRDVQCNELAKDRLVSLGNNIGEAQVLLKILTNEAPTCHRNQISCSLGKSRLLRPALPHYFLLLLFTHDPLKQDLNWMKKDD